MPINEKAKVLKERKAKKKPQGKRNRIYWISENQEILVITIILFVIFLIKNIKNLEY